MRKGYIAILCIISVFCLVLASVSYAAEKETAATKFKKFWQGLFNYPANVTEKSAGVVADTGKRGTEIMTKEVKTTGQVTSGELAKTKDLVVEPVKWTAEATKDAVERTVKIPVEAAKSEPAK
jgi:hypothetical protein